MLSHGTETLIFEYAHCNLYSQEFLSFNEIISGAMMCLPEVAVIVSGMLLLTWVLDYMATYMSLHTHIVLLTIFDLPTSVKYPFIWPDSEIVKNKSRSSEETVSYEKNSFFPKTNVAAWLAWVRTFSNRPSYRRLPFSGLLSTAVWIRAGNVSNLVPHILYLNPGSTTLWTVCLWEIYLPL